MVIVLAGGIITYTLLVRPIQSGLSSLDDIHRANERIENQEPYEPPEEGALSPGQVERFAATQRIMHQRLQEKLATMQEKYEELSEEWKTREPSVREAMGAWGDVIKLYADAKAIQVDALNAEGFSLAEYEFVRSSFFRTMGVDVLPYRIDDIAKQVSERESMMDLRDFQDFEQFQRDLPEMSEEALEKNRELVGEYSEEMQDWLFFAWWGL